MIESILLTRQQIEQRVRELAEEINRDYANQELILIGVLKGSVMFLADLLKELKLDLEVGFISLSSYQGATRSSGEVKQAYLPLPDLSGRNVLLVEDILDTGKSFTYAWNLCAKEDPASLKTCTLLVKEGSLREDLPSVNYQGFTIPNVFVVGYGLDHMEKFRNLPYVAIPKIE